MLKSLANRLFKFLCILDDSMAHMDEVGFTDPGKREALLKEIVRMEVPNPTEAKIYIDVHLAGEKALADLGAYVKESFEKDIEDGKNSSSGRSTAFRLSLASQSAPSASAFRTNSWKSRPPSPRKP